jgi:hypothetical protein
MYRTGCHESGGAGAQVQRVLHIGPELLRDIHRHPDADADAGGS